MPRKENNKQENPLNEITGFNNLVNYYEKYNKLNIKEWLTFEETVKKPGKQGLVGIF